MSIVGNMGRNSAKEAVTKANRAWELDFARGVAVLLMSVFHAVFDLATYFNANISYLEGFWFYVGRFSAILFMFVSGISSCFSKRPFKRGLIVFGCGMVITAVSIPIMGENYIRFGILHFFGSAIILKGAAQLLTKDNKKLCVGAICLIPISIWIGRIFSNVSASTSLFIPIGITPNSFTSYDYYPLFPWLAFFSAGVAAAFVLYDKKRGVISRPSPFESNIVVKGVRFLGEHSLIIYLLHQPVIMAVLYIVFSISKILL